MINTKKKILFVTPYFYPQLGGLEYYVYNIAKGLIKKYGWQVIVATSNTLDRNYHIDNIGPIKVYRLPRLFKISNTPISPFWYWDIKRIIRTEKPDLINAHSPVPFMADMAALAAGSVPFVLTYHAGTMKKRKFFADLLIWVYENILLNIVIKKSDRVICSSEFVRNTMMKSFKDKSVVITPAVDIARFKPLKGIRQFKNTVLFICRYANMQRMKGLNTLVEAMKLLPFANLRIVGEKGNITGKNIKYTGVKIGRGLVREIQNCNVFVLASLAHMESFGMVLAENMACKTPVIGTRIGGIPEVITDGIDGFIVRPENPEELAAAIEKVLTNRQLAVSMGEAGFNKVRQKFNWDIKTDDANKIFTRYI